MWLFIRACVVYIEKMGNGVTWHLVSRRSRMRGDLDYFMQSLLGLFYPVGIKRRTCGVSYTLLRRSTESDAADGSAPLTSFLPSFFLPLEKEKSIKPKSKRENGKKKKKVVVVGWESHSIKIPQYHLF